MATLWVNKDVMCTDVKVKEYQREVHIVSFYNFSDMSVHSVIDQQAHKPRKLFVKDMMLYKEVHVPKRRRDSMQYFKLAEKPVCRSVQKGFDQWLSRQIVM